MNLRVFGGEIHRSRDEEDVEATAHSIVKAGFLRQISLENVQGAEALQLLEVANLVLVAYYQ